MISAETFRVVQSVVHERAGIVIPGGKEYLVESKLDPLAASIGFDGIAELVAALQLGRDPILAQAVVEAIGNHETSFFRDLDPFEALGDGILPDWIRANRGRRELRICSAATASGQEAYSLAMLLLDRFPEVANDWNVEIVALDMNFGLIERARSGEYSVLEVNRGLPARLLTRFFERAGAKWRVIDDVRRLVSFRQHNLLEDELPGAFDVVFLRNVLMYFDPETKARVLADAHRAMSASGVLFIGATETLLGVEEFERQTVRGCACYRPRLPATALDAGGDSKTNRR